MSFLNPILLFGAAAIVAPIMIHLLNRRQFRRVKWAAMRFVQASMEQNQRRLEMQDLILLLMRCATLALLALVLARPLANRFQSALLDGNVNSVLVIDQSASMTAPAGTVTRFGLAKQAALRHINQLPANAVLTILSASDQTAAPVLEASSDTAAARAAIDALQVTHQTSTWQPALKRALAILAAAPSGRKEFVVITDDTALGWQPIADVTQLLDSDIASMNMVIVGGSIHENLAVTSLTADRQHAFAGQTQRYAAMITNYGETDRKDVAVAFHVGAEPVGNPRVIPELKTGESESVAFFLKATDSPYQRITARLPADDFAIDDERNLVLPMRQQLRLLLVDGEPNVRARDGETFFLLNALVPVPPVLRPKYYVQPTVISANEFREEEFSDDIAAGKYDAVFLSNVASVPAEMSGPLQAFVRQGGGLVIFPGELVDHANYHQQIGGKDGVLPAQLAADTEAAIVPVSLNRTVIRRLDYRKTAVSDQAFLSTLADDADGLASAEFWRTEPLEIAPTAAAQVLLRFNDNTAALVAGKFDAGHVLMFASTADTKWNDLPTQTQFVPLIREVLALAVSGSTPSLNIAAGETFSYPLPAQFNGAEATTFSLADATTTGQALALAADSTGKVRLVTAPISRAGFYESRTEQPPMQIQFATQLDTRESRLAPLRERDLAQLKQCVTITNVADADELDNIVREQAGGSELTRLSLLALLGLTFGELLLAQRFSRSK